MKSLSIICLVLVFASCQKTQNEAVNKARQTTIDSMQTEVSKQKVIDSMKLEIAEIKEKNNRTQNVTVVNHPQSVAATAPAKKKGWSSTAKGAVIGAGVGAATGAIVSKNKGEGAIIGVLAGAGVGAGTGAIIDGSKKNKNN